MKPSTTLMRFKPSKKQATKEEKLHMSKVAKLPCIIANEDCAGRVEVHHITGAGMGLRSSNFDVLPLCFNHHSAQTPLPYGFSVHKGTKQFEMRYGTQRELLGKVYRMLGI